MPIFAKQGYQWGGEGTDQIPTSLTYLAGDRDE